MTASYSKNIHLLIFFAYYTLDSQVSLSSRMISFEFAWTSEKIKTLKIIYSKNLENLKNSKPRVQFY